MNWITVIMLTLAGVLALSGLIIAQKPQAKDLIDKLVPFQGIIGVVLLVWGIINAARMLPHMNDMTASGFPMSILLAAVGTLVAELGLGFLFGMPLVAKWIPGDSPAEQKAMEMQKKVLPFQSLLGVVAIVAAVLMAYVTNKYGGRWW
ncbi:MAG: hypothetical protein IPH44_02570 [Myxococcales bacterium]|jgi:hypothetical protein|nr:hypothetical protein [Myxococcales bacterium]MBK7198203.1 hypothetical protein [Myxococcales bacterium]MBP6845335.1 hypothetical protein [Kofleriaceae bacterium]